MNWMAGLDTSSRDVKVPLHSAATPSSQVICTIAPAKKPPAKFTKKHAEWNRDEARWGDYPESRCISQVTSLHCNTSVWCSPPTKEWSAARLLPLVWRAGRQRNPTFVQWVVSIKISWRLPAAKPASRSWLLDACLPLNQMALKEWKQ